MYIVNPLTHLATRVVLAAMAVDLSLSPPKSRARDRPRLCKQSLDALEALHKRRVVAAVERAMELVATKSFETAGPIQGNYERELFKADVVQKVKADARMTSSSSLVRTWPKRTKTSAADRHEPVTAGTTKDT